MTVFAASQKGVPLALLSAVTTGTSSPALMPITVTLFRVHIVVAQTASAGVISLEEALDPAFAGTWSVLQSIDVTALSGGGEVTYHGAGNCQAIRARVTSNITGGGTVTATLITN